MAPDFRRFFEAAPGAYLVLAPDPPRYTILAASDLYVRAVKATRENLVGRPVFEALPAGQEDTSSEVFSRASFQRVIDLRAPDTMPVQRHDLARSEAEGGGFEVRYWSVTNSPVLGDGGEVVAVLHKAEDVTEFIQLKQRQAESEGPSSALRERLGKMEVEIYRRAQELQQLNAQLLGANAKLAEADRAKTIFFSNVSHEFRTPLTLMLGALEELLRDEGRSADERLQLEVAHRNSLRLLRLVNSLLEFARAQAGQLEPQLRATDLAGLTALLASSFESVCARAGLRLRVDCPPLGKPVNVDRDQWERIVLNLLSNAFKFTHQGEIDVTLRAVGEGCELSVRDTGVGIAEAELPRLFERFHRVEGALGRTMEGTGIGLALVKELVELHGGRVGVSSSPGSGSTFTVWIPFGEAREPREDTPAPEAAAPGARALVEEALGMLPEHLEHGAPGQQAQGERARVIVAEDNPDMRAHLQRLLTRDFAVEVVSDGEQALQATRRSRPDVVITDVMMPRLDGFGLLAKLKADPELRAIPVILLSARAGGEVRGEGFEAGADDYLMKPFSARELIARVHAALRLARAQQEVSRAAGREEALKETDRRKDEFLAMLSHELRNPLAPIRNGVAVLQRAPPGGEQARRALEIIDRQTVHLTRLVEDLLEVSRITQGKLPLQKEPLSLDELVRGVAEDARATFERAGIELETRVEGAPLMVEGDPTRLAQVVGNLLSNAAKFTPRGGHVWLSLTRHERQWAEIRVRDDGAGLHDELHEHLFQPFVQADRTLDRSAGGLGLGLAVVKGLVHLHGGTVSAHSEGVGRGTEVTVRLPLLERAEPHRGPAPPAHAGDGSRRVLLVEDNRDAAQSLRELLELSGHEVLVEFDGESALRRARASAPDTIICDIGLPGMDGYAVARAVRADAALAAIRLVAITGYAAADDARAAREAGFDHHLAKPPDLGLLEKVLADRG